MREFWGRIWANVLSLLGTTTFSILVFAIGVPVASFVLTFAWEAYHQRKSGAQVSKLARDAFLSPQTIITLGLAVVAWGIALSWALVRTVNQDNAKLKSQSTTIADLGSENERLRGELAQKPKEVLRQVALPAPEEPRRCWFVHVPDAGNPPYAGMKSAMHVIVMCNKKTELPFRVRVTLAPDSVPVARFDTFDTRLEGGISAVSTKIIPPRTLEVTVSAGRALAPYTGYVIRMYTTVDGANPYAESATVEHIE